MSALQKAEIAKGKSQLWDKKEKEIEKEFFVLQAAAGRQEHSEFTQLALHLLCPATTL